MLTKNQLLEIYSAKTQSVADVERSLNVTLMDVSGRGSHRADLNVNAAVSLVWLSCPQASGVMG